MGRPNSVGYLTSVKYSAIVAFNSGIIASRWRHPAHYGSSIPSSSVVTPYFTILVEVGVNAYRLPLTTVE